MDNTIQMGVLQMDVTMDLVTGSPNWDHVGMVPLATSQTQLLFAHLCAFVLATGRK